MTNNAKLRQQVAAVLATRLHEVSNRADRYDNRLGCYNCGDCGHVYRDLQSLAEALADKLCKTKGAKLRFLADAGLKPKAE